MSDVDNQVLAEIRAHVAAFPPDRQLVINELARQVREIATSEAGMLAVCLVGAELSARAED